MTPTIYWMNCYYPSCVRRIYPRYGNSNTIPGVLQLIAEPEANAGIGTAEVEAVKSRNQYLWDYFNDNQVAKALQLSESGHLTVSLGHGTYAFSSTRRNSKAPIWGCAKCNMHLCIHKYGRNTKTCFETWHSCPIL